MSSKKGQAPSLPARSQSYTSQVLHDAGPHHVPFSHDDFETDEPPRYSNLGPVVTTAAHDPPSSWITVPNVDFYKYRLPQATVSLDQEVVTTRAAELVHDPEALLRVVNAQAALPPRPAVRIRGGEAGAYVFDLTVNVQASIVHPTGRQWNYVTVDPAGEEPFFKNAAAGSSRRTTEIGVEGWVQLFCEDSSDNKQFILERKVVNWDTEYIEGQIRNMVANLKFPHPVEVTFPSSYSRVVVLKDRSIGKGNAAFDVSSMWSGLKKLLELKPAPKYAMVQSVWPYASGPPGAPQRECVAQTEQAWWHAWKVPIRNAMLAHRKGPVTVEDRIEAAMGFVLPAVNSKWMWYGGPQQGAGHCGTSG